MVLLYVFLVIVAAAAVIVIPSIRVIGPTQVGLVMKRVSVRKLSEDSPVAFAGEAGYQAELLMPGVRWKFWGLYRVDKYPWVQVPAGEIGVVISQLGQPLPIGAKSAVYKAEFENFTDLGAFMEHGGQKGVQRPVLPPGTLIPIHPVAFLVVTKNKIYGLPISQDIKEAARLSGELSCAHFGLEPEQLNVVRIQPRAREIGRDIVDMVGIVTVY